MGRLLVTFVVLGVCTRAAAQDAVVDGDTAMVADELDSSEALAAPDAEATVAPEAAAQRAFALGLQLAADGTFTEPALTPQVGFIFHIRLPDAFSLRVAPSIGYVWMQSEPYPSAGEPRGWDDERLMAELRIGAGYAVTPWLEGRLFVAARTIHRHVAGQPPVYVRVDTTPWPVEIRDGYPAYWVHRIAVSGGTEWTLRPDRSSGFEITASLGLGGIGTVLYNPHDGSPRFNMNAGHAHGALALGWLFDV